MMLLAWILGCKRALELGSLHGTDTPYPKSTMHGINTFPWCHSPKKTHFSVGLLCSGSGL